MKKKEEDLDNLDILLENEEEIHIMEADLPPSCLYSQTPKSEWEQVLDRLSIACAQEKVWLGIPSKEPVITLLGSYYPEYVREISDCTGEEFIRWLEKCFPRTKQHQHTPADYKDVGTRKKIVYIVEETYKNFYKYPIKISTTL